MLQWLLLHLRSPRWLWKVVVLCPACEPRSYYGLEIPVLQRLCLEEMERAGNTSYQKSVHPKPLIQRSTEP